MHRTRLCFGVNGKFAKALRSCVDLIKRTQVDHHDWQASIYSDCKCNSFPFHLFNHCLTETSRNRRWPYSKSKIECETLRFYHSIELIIFILNILRAAAVLNSTMAHTDVIKLLSFLVHIGWMLSFELKGDGRLQSKHSIFQSLIFIVPFPKQKWSAIQPARTRINGKRKMRKFCAKPAYGAVDVHES